jgi:hypothetical protein
VTRRITSLALVWTLTSQGGYVSAFDTTLDISGGGQAGYRSELDTAPHISGRDEGGYRSVFDTNPHVGGSGQRVMEIAR